MQGPRSRGYTITRTLDFVESGYFEPKVVDRILASVPTDLRETYANLKPHEWYPMDYAVPLLRGIAEVQNDDKGSAEDLANFGRTVASEATNSFLKILMKLMTPALFVRKFPDLYQRDHQGCGRFEVDTKDIERGKIGMRLIGADGFDHIGAAAVGFFKFGMEAIAGPGCVDVKLNGWSMATPSPSEIEYDITIHST